MKDYNRKLNKVASFVLEEAAGYAKAHPEEFQAFKKAKAERRGKARQKKRGGEAA